MNMKFNLTHVKNPTRQRKLFPRPTPNNLNHTENLLQFYAEPTLHTQIFRHVTASHCSDKSSKTKALCVKATDNKASDNKASDNKAYALFYLRVITNQYDCSIH